jgi:hypothetical protein
MYNKPLVLTIILVVLAGLIAPFIYARISAGAAGPPRLAPPPGGEKQCVESKEYMREHHVDVLIRWRDSSVREGKLKYVASSGKEYVMGLTTTCIGCHSNKADFCDRCHDYASVHPRCWDCHTFPEKGDKAK